MAIIHGANGIVYFVHEWTGGFREDGIFRHPDTVDAVRAVDNTISALAPVLNSPSLPDLISVSNPKIATMVKARDNVVYVFAVSMQSEPVRASFTLRAASRTVVSVFDENRTLSVVRGQIADDFDSYGVHIYRIARSDGG